jgi:hypothetical protein
MSDRIHGGRVGRGPAARAGSAQVVKTSGQTKWSNQRSSPSWAGGRPRRAPARRRRRRRFLDRRSAAAGAETPATLPHGELRAPRAAPAPASRGRLAAVRRAHPAAAGISRTPAGVLRSRCLAARFAGRRKQGGVSRHAPLRARLRILRSPGYGRRREHASMLACNSGMSARGACGSVSLRSCGGRRVARREEAPARSPRAASASGIATQ